MRQAKGVDHKAERAAKVSNWELSYKPDGVHSDSIGGPHFDSLDVGEWFHLEQMDTFLWHMSFAHFSFYVEVDPHGTGSVVRDPDALAKLPKKE